MLYNKTAQCFATRFDVKRNGPVNCMRYIEIERDSKMEEMRTEGPLGPRGPYLFHFGVKFYFNVSNSIFGPVEFYFNSSFKTNWAVLL